MAQFLKIRKEQFVEGARNVAVNVRRILEVYEDSQGNVILSTSKTGYTVSGRLDEWVEKIETARRTKFKPTPEEETD